RVAHQFRAQNLERHLLAELPVERAIHRAHAAGADFLGNLESVGEQLAGCERRRFTAGRVARRVADGADLAPERLHLLPEPRLAYAHLVRHAIEYTREAA